MDEENYHQSHQITISFYSPFTTITLVLVVVNPLTVTLHRYVPLSAALSCRNNTVFVSTDREPS